MVVPLVKTQSLIKRFSVKRKRMFGFGHSAFESSGIFVWKATKAVRMRGGQDSLLLLELLTSYLQPIIN